MSIVFLLLAPAIFALFWLIKLQICLSRVRYLVDTYGIDRKKLRKLSCREIRALRSSIDDLRQENDTIALEALIRPYRA